MPIRLEQMAKRATDNTIYDLILDALKRHPEGLTIYEIRDAIDYPGVQQHLDRRVRDLRKKHVIPLKKGGKYVYEGERSDPPPDSGAISGRLRAAVLNMAHGKCQMCGRTVKDDDVKLVPDHKVPHNWGGPTVIENLWAICTDCNGGKRDFFATFDDDEMAALVAIESVHHRLAQVLKKREGDDVPSWFLQFVANVNNFQEDWQRRLRELREFGIDYDFKKKRLASGKVESSYTLTKWAELPDDPSAEIRANNRKARAAKRL